MKDNSKFAGFFKAIKFGSIKFTRFVQRDLWRIDKSEASGLKRILITPFRVVYMTVMSFINDDIVSKASSLTYNTALAIVPMLAIIVGIGKGFGLQNALKQMMIDIMPNQTEEFGKIFTYVDNYLDYVQGGVFIGVGFIVLLYTVLMLISSIEDTFNSIWQAPYPRSWGKRIFNYLGLFLLLPLVLTASSAINFVSQTLRSTDINDYVFVGPLMTFILDLIPVVLIIFTFVMLYVSLPNVKVKFLPALIAGIISGLSFHIFQTIYIHGMLWISTYNAIYGSFAAFPLLLLWLNLSWIIILFGAQLSYCIQNSDSYYYHESSNSASRRYRDFVLLLVLSEITKCFMDPKKPYITSQEISKKCNIPINLCNKVVSKLLHMKLIIEIKKEGSQSDALLQPAIDTSLMSVGYVLNRLDIYGSEDLPIDNKGEFSDLWEATIHSRKGFFSPSMDKLIRDL